MLQITRAKQPIFEQKIRIKILPYQNHVFQFARDTKTAVLLVNITLNRYSY